MSSVVIETSPWASIRGALMTMREHDVGALPVVAGGRLLGIVTDGDVIRGCFPGAKAETPVRRLMSWIPVTCGEADPVARAAALMEERQVRRLPVLDRDGRLVGMLAASDLPAGLSEAAIHNTRANTALANSWAKPRPTGATPFGSPA